VDGDFLGTSPIRVLIVDDNEPFRQFLRSTLQNKLELQTIVEASDGEEAIELAQALQPDLILLDIGLPKLNGIEAARRIRELASRSKIIFFSQESSLEVVQGAFSADLLIGGFPENGAKQECRFMEEGWQRSKCFVLAPHLENPPGG